MAERGRNDLTLVGMTLPGGNGNRTHALVAKTRDDNLTLRLKPLSQKVYGLPRSEGFRASRHADREDVKIPNPKPFTGDPKKARVFRVQATAKTKSPKYNTKEIKTRYVTNLLRERAADWFVNYASLDGTYQFKTLKVFWQQFQTQFVDQDPAGTAMTRIFDVKQGARDVQAYLSEMYPLLIECKIGFKATGEMFIRGLSADNQSVQFFSTIAHDTDEDEDENNDDETKIQDYRRKVGQILRRVETSMRRKNLLQTIMQSTPRAAATTTLRATACKDPTRRPRAGPGSRLAWPTPIMRLD
ncbi:MAG: hypothetical protein M1816_001635 [Peltula sp. TS41687]|nr:MAG: hypothetical protein M1816_001635 [Peltula sp. TS41687]